MKKKMISAAIILFCLFSLFLFANNAAKNDSVEPVAEQEQVIPCSTDSECLNMSRKSGVLHLVGQITYPYLTPFSPFASFGIDEHHSGQKVYSETEISKTSFSIFDEKKRLVYALTPIIGITDTRNGYTIHDYEENFYERNDDAHTCRHIYYQSDVASYDITYDSCYYVSNRYMREIEDWQFSEDGRLISYLQYSPKITGPTSPLYFNYGYQAEYDGEYLMSEIICTSSNTWNYYHAYQYDDAGRCILEIVADSHTVALSTYEYNDIAKQITKCDYLVIDELELSFSNGDIYSFYTGYSDRDTRPIVRKTAADGTVLTELFFQMKYDMGQADFLTDEEVENTLNIHKYVMTQPGDSLWSIAEQYYGSGTCNDILYQANRDTVGWNKDVLLPGIRLRIPELWTSAGDILNLF